MKTRRSVLTSALLLILTTCTAIQAQTTGNEAPYILTLEACRAAALSESNTMKMAQEKKEQNEAIRKAALSEFFPKLSANGGYLYSNKSISLLSDEQEERLRTIGTTAHGKLEPVITSLGASMITSGNQALAMALLQSTQGLDIKGDLNGFGGDIADDLTLDTRNIFVGAVSITQPIYLGGKLREMYKIARMASEMAGIEYDKAKEELLIGVDEAYWQVVSLQNKEELAKQYCTLLQDLSNNVDAMLEAEVATRADQTKVRVKLNEAQMSLTKATGGLKLAKMLLCQRCGIDLYTNFTADEGIELTNYQPEENINMENVYSQRAEMRMLDIAESITNSGVRIAASALKPNIAATASYIMTNPSLSNGFAKEWNGMATAGVVVNIPLCHADAIYSVKAAKHKRTAAQLQIAEAREMIELQVNKLNYELEVANTKLTQAESNLTNAEENLRLANESFATGLISSSDLMAAQTAYISAKSEVIDARIEIRMAYLYLRQAMGKSL